MTELIIIAVSLLTLSLSLLAIIICLLVLHNKERKEMLKTAFDERQELCDRIMSDSLKEYKLQTRQPDDVCYVSAHEKALKKWRHEV